MRRRTFIAGIGTAAAWPLAARAQQPGMPVIGLLSTCSPAVDAALISVIRQGLNDTGFVEGRNIALDYRWADGQYDRLAALAADLVHRQEAVNAEMQVNDIQIAARSVGQQVDILNASTIREIDAAFARLGITDIVAEQYHAGVRSGEQVAKDMIAVRISPDMRMAVIGSPSYFKNRPEPKKPQDLLSHNCINLRLPMHGNQYAWEFEKGSRELRVRVEGQLIFNGTAQLLNAALAGCGLAYVPEGMIEAHVNKGRLRRVLADWCPPYSGYHLFYPNRRQSSAAFVLVVDALRSIGVVSASNRGDRVKRRKFIIGRSAKTLEALDIYRDAVTYSIGLLPIPEFDKR
jgi:LysR substrate binding domain